MNGEELFRTGRFFEFVDLNLPKIEHMQIGRKTRNNPNIVKELHVIASCQSIPWKDSVAI